MFPDTASFSWMDGWIILEELPVFAPHGYVSGEVAFQVRATIPNLSSSLDTSLSTPNWTMQADASFLPAALPNPGPGHANAATHGGTPWPTLVFEVN